MDVCTPTLNLSSDSNRKSVSGVQKTFSTTQNVSSPRIETFLRIRSTNSLSAKDKNHVSIYSMENSSTLLVKQCNLSNITRRSKAYNNEMNKKYVFSKIFNPGINQLRFFEEAIKPTIVNFLNHQSSTVITYGTADAGKSYTLYGTSLDPGVIPRSIEFIYSSLDIIKEPKFKPKQFCNIVRLEESERNDEYDFKDKILSSKLNNKLVCKELYKLIQNTKLSKNEAANRESLCACIWISFIEIYNDVIFDLLDVDEDGKKVQLKLISDKNGVTCLEGLRSICTSTGTEALEILFIGQSRLTTLLTSSYKSSRSHSIFIIKLLEYKQDSAPTEVKMTSISFCDLAGPGRIKKVMFDDRQLRESRSINKSLLAFGRYFKIVSDDHSKQNTGSFRESKLTRILQQSFRNKEKIVFLTHLNPSLELFAESQSILKFASTMIKIMPENIKVDKKISNHTTNSSARSQKSRLPVAQKLKINELVVKNKKSEAQLIESILSKLREEYKARRESIQFYSEGVNNQTENMKFEITVLVEENKNLLKFSVSHFENYYNEKVDEKCLNRKRKRIDRGDYEESLDVENLKIENSKFLAKILLLKASIERINNENKQLNVQKNCYAFELSLLKNSLKQLVEFINRNKENLYESNFEIFNSDISNIGIIIDHDTVLYLVKIQEFIKTSLQSGIIQNHSKCVFSASTQCDLNYSIVNEFYKELKTVLDLRKVNLLEIENFSSVAEGTHESIDLVKIFSEFIKLILSYDSMMKNIEIENNNKLNEIKLLEDKLRSQERKILETKLQDREVDSIRLLFSNEIQNKKEESKIEKLYENLKIMKKNEETAFEPSSADTALQLNLSESISEKSENITLESNLNCSKNDSGLALSVESACKVTFEKSCQTISTDLVGKSFSLLQERFLQLKVEYKQMEERYVHELQRASELSEELESVKTSLVSLKEKVAIQEQTIKNCQNELCVSKLDVKYLYNEKRDLKEKCNRLTKNLRKLTESQMQQKIREKRESRPIYGLENYWQKTRHRRSKSYLIYCELDDMLAQKSYKEHTFEITESQNSLRKEELYENKLKLQENKYTKDLSIIGDLSEKVNCLENVFDKIQRDKSHLHKLFGENWKIQSKLEKYLQNLVDKVEKRDHELFLLKSNLHSIVQSNLSNCQKAKELGLLVSKLTERVSVIKKEMIQSEESKKDPERNENDEIDTLKGQLKKTFKENTELLNIIFNNQEIEQTEIGKLKGQLLKKQRELDFFKRNRNITIQRYERLVKQLQDALKANNSSRKLRKPFYSKPKYFYNDAR